MRVRLNAIAVARLGSSLREPLVVVEVEVMRFLRAVGVSVFVWIAFGLASPARAAEVVTAGARLESLSVGATIYRDVQIRSITARAVMITHTGGLASIRLRDLTPEWQERFNYSAEAEAAAEEAARLKARPTPPTPSTKAASAKNESKFERLLKQFDEPPVVQSAVDLRPKFFKLELNVKNQGRRPSCAIFAVVSALEFQHTEATGTVEKLSEEYLTWAVRQRSGARGGSAFTNEAKANDPTDEDGDAGFSLHEVLTALAAYGIAPQSSMPNALGRKMADIAAPSPEVIAQARNSRSGTARSLPGRDRVAQIGNLVHALNAGVPVPVGVRWPHYRTLQSGYLDAQKPLATTGHAITLVGYTSATNKLADTVFIFKNSYGPTWGQGGYGYVTYRYLASHLGDAYVIEVQSGISAARAAAGR